MMTLPSFSLDALLAPAVCIFVTGFIISFLVTRSPSWSFSAAFVKAAIFAVYFATFFDGTYTFLDDWSYLRRGSVLLDQGVSITNMFAHLPELFVQAGGPHFVYYLFNADSFRLFGEAYYAPVAINVILTFFTAAFMALAARGGLGFSRPLAAALFFCTALHPDIVAWSTIMNGKDTLVLACTALVVYAISLVDKKKMWLATVLGVVVGVVLFFTRFYVPLMLLAALFAAGMLSPFGRRRPGLWLLLPAALIAMLSVLGSSGLADAYGRLVAGFANPLYGIPRMLLTPIPFHTTANYAFLNIPQVIEWALMPAMLYGILRIWMRATITARFVVMYFSCMLVLYGMFENLQGPRHRVQIDGLIALFQFYGALGLLKQVAPGRPRLSRTASISQPVVIRE